MKHLKFYSITRGFKTTHPQHGRSMIETLGVLAVMALLSIGAVALYRYALNKHLANETINQLSQYALVVDNQILNNAPSFNLDELGSTTRQGYPVQAYRLEDPAFFEISLSQVPVKVCELILKSDWKLPLVIYVNDYAYKNNVAICMVDDQDTPAEMAFQFHTGLNTDILPYGTCETASDCVGDCVTCEEGLCVTTCQGDERCLQDINGTGKMCCPADRRAGPYCCASSVNGWCCNETGQCCPWHKPLIDRDGACYDCADTKAIDVTGATGNCNVCPNRELSGNKCIVKCREGEFRDWYGVCRSCYDQEPFYYMSQTQRAAECITKCPNRKQNGYNDSACSYDLCGQGIFKNKPLSDYRGNCYACDEPTNIDVSNVSHEGCDVCENRYLNGTLCMLDCPEGQVRDNNGTCRSCYDQEPFYYVTNQLLVDECIAKCPNRKKNGYNDSACSYDLCGQGIFKNKPLTDWNGNCYACDEPRNINVDHVSHEGCDVCKNRYLNGTLCMLDCPEGQVRDNNGTCRSCYDQEPFYYMSKIELANECVQKCPNRKKGGFGDSACVYDLCGQGAFKDKPLSDYIGRCYTCEEPANIDVSNVSHEGCIVCPDTRNQYNTMCVPKCPADKPLRGSDNKCYACDDPTDIPVGNMPDVCYECPDERRLEGNLCVLK